MRRVDEWISVHCRSAQGATQGLEGSDTPIAAAPLAPSLGAPTRALGPNFRARRVEECVRTLAPGASVLTHSSTRRARKLGPRALVGAPKEGASGAAAICLLYTSPSPRDRQKSRMPSSA